MALVSKIKAGDKISHYGVFSEIVGVSVDDRMIVLQVQEDGSVGTRTEDPKFNIPLLGE